jgi:hypothetical protein
MCACAGGLAGAVWLQSCNITAGPRGDVPCSRKRGECGCGAFLSPPSCVQLLAVAVDLRTWLVVVDGRPAARAQINLADAKQRDFADRLQNFAFFFVDGASRVDLEDERWRWVALWTRGRTDGVASTPAAAAPSSPPTAVAPAAAAADADDWVAAGYMTLYRFNNPIWPRPHILRVCQVLVLPPFQRRGLGSLLYRTACGSQFGGSNYVWEVTVESPCDAFVAMRDAVNLDRFASFVDQAWKGKPLEWPGDLSAEVHKQLRLPKAQGKRIFDMYKHRQVKDNADQAREFRLAAKRDLYAAAKAQVDEEDGLRGEASRVRGDVVVAAMGGGGGAGRGQHQSEGKPRCERERRRGAADRYPVINSPTSTKSGSWVTRRQTNPPALKGHLLALLHPPSRCARSQRPRGSRPSWRQPSSNKNRCAEGGAGADLLLSGARLSPSLSCPTSHPLPSMPALWSPFLSV